VVLPDGRRVDLDASHGDYAGWHVPNERIYKVGIWNESGQPVADRQTFRGLHGYVLRRGMGDDTTDFTPSIPDSFVTQADSGPTGVDLLVAQQNAAAPASSSFNWGSLFGNLANQWTQIGSRVLAPSTTYVRNADGSVSLVTPGSSAAASSLLSSTSPISSNTLLLVGGGLVALLVVGSLMGKK
jgi:hypothetical protein